MRLHVHVVYIQTLHIRFVVVKFVQELGAFPETIAEDPFSKELSEPFGVNAVRPSCPVEAFRFFIATVVLEEKTDFFLHLPKKHTI